MIIKEKDVIDVWFSCGAASAIAAKITIEKYPECKIRVLNNPIVEEDADNRRFLRDVEKWLGVGVRLVSSSKYPSCSAVDVWGRRRFMVHRNGAPCTSELKIKARLEWSKKNPCDWMVLGFTSDEEGRHDDFVERGVDNLIPVLIDEGITKADCYMMLHDAGIEVPAIYKRGYPNANCIGCVKATSPTYWNHVRKKDPEVFKAREKQSREIGARLVRVKGERIFLDELKEGDLGRPMKDMDFECGIFCASS